MNFLNVGPWELMVLLIIAILLLGPKRMVELARIIGHATSQMRQLSNEFLGTIQAELRATEHETHQTLENIAKGEPEPVASIRAELEATEHETRQTLEDIAKGKPEPVASIRAALEDTERETRQVLEDIIKDEPGQRAG